MHRSIVPALVVLTSFCGTKCTKYVHPPLSETERLLRTGSWILAYTDSTSFDSVNVLHYFHLPAMECEKKEPISFVGGLNYQMHLVCNQTVPGELMGTYSYNAQDSTLGFGLKTDTPVWLPVAILKMISHDS